MSAMELDLMTLAEVTTTELHKSNDSQDMTELEKDAKTGGGIAGQTRKNNKKVSKNNIAFFGSIV